MPIYGNLPNKFSIKILSNVNLIFYDSEEYQGLLTYYVPPTEIMKWSRMFSLMEAGKQTLDIEDYSISQTSLEQVFLSFTKYQIEETHQKRRANE